MELHTQEVSYKVVKKPLEERLLDAACIYWGKPRDFFKDRGARKQKDVIKWHILFYLMITDNALGLRDLSSEYGISKSAIGEIMRKMEFQKGIYRTVADDIKAVRQIADNLDAEMITVGVQIHTRAKG